MHKLNDHELVSRAKSGDDSAFNELMLRHYKGVLNYIYRFTNGSNSTEDLTQEVFYRVYKSLDKYKPEAQFTTWLYKIATNLCISDYKKNKRNYSLDEITENTGNMEDNSFFDADDNVYRKELKKKIDESLKQLNEKERVAITLCKYQGFSYNEVAEVLDCTVGAVKTHIYRGRMKLVEILGDLVDEKENEKR